MTDEWEPGVAWETDPEGSILTHRIEVGPWRVEATWPATHSLTAGPTSLHVVVTPDLGEQYEHRDEIDRGLTTTVLRRVEAALVESLGSDEHRKELAGRLSEAEERMREAVADLRGHGPRTFAGDYYAELLRAHQALTAEDNKAPNQTLARALGVSLETLRTQLKQARRRALETKEGA